ncbi:MAG: hypothetical protein ACOC6A_04030 [Chloroflexota bacterium]
MSEDVYKSRFTPSVVRWGMITLWVGVALSFVPAFYLWSGHGIMPSGADIAAGFGLILAIVIAFWFVEPISYYPVLGLPGTYLSFLAGNISNLRVPCSAVAQEAAGVQEGTPRASIISTIAIAVSMLVNTVVLFIGAVGLAGLVSNLPESVLHAFDFILPAIFGAIFGQFALRSYALGAIALGLGLILNYAGVLPSWGVLLALVFGSILIARLLWEKGKLGSKEA